MSRYFLFLTLILFLLINESTVHWLLAITVGNLSLSDGFNRAFRFLSFESLLFSGGFRVIPYVFIILVVYNWRLPFSLSGKIYNWLALAATAFFLGYGYWDMQHPLYTDEDLSSTSGIAIVVIPFYAILVGIIAGALGYMTSRLVRLPNNS